MIIPRSGLFPAWYNCNYIIITCNQLIVLICSCRQERSHFFPQNYMEMIGDGLSLPRFERVKMIFRSKKNTIIMCSSAIRSNFVITYVPVWETKKPDVTAIDV